ncbi:O-antigen ligase family protein [Paenibacillus marinisediminis]
MKGSVSNELTYYPVIERRLHASAAGITGLAVVLCISLWRQGSFYDKGFLSAEILIITTSIVKLLQHAVTGRRGMIVENRLSILFPWMAAMGYAAALLLDPASTHGTWMQCLRWTAYGAWGYLLIGMVCDIPRTGKQWWDAVMTATGWFISFGSLIMLYGWFTYDGGVMLSSNAEITALGFRLGGWFQYPNALGAVAGAYVLYHLHRVAVAKTIYSWAISGTSILLHTMVLILTESRGAGLVVLVAVAIWLLTSRYSSFSAKGWGFWFVVWGVLASVGSAQAWLTEGWWISLPFLIACTGSVWLPCVLGLRSTNQDALVLSKRSTIVIVLCGVLVLGATWLLQPEESGSRLSGHFDTMSARGLFYKDAFTLWKESPWMGSGGDAWRQQFASIQSEPYVGKEVHSSLADLLLDIGLIGTLLTVSLAAVALLRAWKRDPGAGLAAGVVIGHSLIDFDLSYGAIALLAMSWLAYGWFPIMGEQGVEERRGLPRRGGRLAAAVVAAALLVPAAMGLRMVGANALYAAGASEANAAAQQAALSLAPADTALRIAVSKQLPPQEALALLQAGERYERAGKALHRELALAAERARQLREAAAYWEAAVKDDRFDKELRTEAVVRLAGMADMAASRGDAALASELAQAAQAHFQRYAADVRQIAAMPHVANDKQFALTSEAERAAASAYIISLGGE